MMISEIVSVMPYLLDDVSPYDGSANEPVNAEPQPAGKLRDQVICQYVRHAVHLLSGAFPAAARIPPPAAGSLPRFVRSMRVA